MSDEDIPDFITQVRNPNETDSETASANQPVQKVVPKKKSCFFLCCGGSSELDDDFSSERGESKKPPPKLSISSGGGGASSGGSGGGASAIPQDGGFNSPRTSGKYQTQGQATYTDDHLLPPPNDVKKGKKCLVLDLDETLVHSSFKQVPCDFVVPVTIEDKTYKVYVAKRPHVDHFLQRCGELYEVVVFTASLAQYADPVIDLLDPNKWVDWRLFRESCTPFKGAYVKDMGRMGRDIATIMILDNSPHSYLFNRENAIPCKTWYNDHTDRELLDLIPALEQLAQESLLDVREKLREMGISPGELEDGLDSTGTEEGSDYTGTEPSQTEGSMEDSDFTGEDVEGSSEYTATESQKGEDPN